MRVQPREVILNLLAFSQPIRARLRRFRDRGRPLDVERLVHYALESLAVRRRFISDEQITEATLLEVGSGKNLGLAVLLLALGARRVVNVEIDNYGFVWGATAYKALAEGASSAGIPIAWPPRGLHVSSDGNTVSPDPELITLHHGTSAVAIPEPDESVDVAFSNAVLEHILCDDIPLAAREFMRVTKPGGYGFHRIDLVDHYYRETEPFRFLRLSSREYRLMYSNRGSSSNRFRMDDMERFFREAGFSSVSFPEVGLYENQAQFARWREDFHADFRDRPTDMLRAHNCMLATVR